ncbi:hypothetical protein BDN72DRAFT_888149 [Pluteus cervinus]|uniref:Uncharacterized protein n=1 Tax=Pluteus cervinus TaxID=181527 RepID=A0ACD3AW70_9AGAR|nr:hypothetical protein BDN72DRAFT_888149 [Pluteus cervinus]
MTSLVNRVVHWKQPRTQTPAQTAVAMDLCEICGLKPKYFEGGFKHPYCSRSCARNGQGPNPSVCILRGCRATGKAAFSNFCSEAHAREGVRLGQVEGCRQCNIQPRVVGEHCLSCDRQIRSTPRLRELDVNGATYKNLRAQFLSEWESPRASPGIEKVYEVIPPRDARARYDAYRGSPINPQEIRTFHSAQCICDLGFKNSALCSFKSCGICSIVKSAFRTFAFGASSNSGRFGEGVYSYRNPALADRFATSCTSSPYRVMIACDALVHPGQISEEQSVFVPVADAILPAYVIMYTKHRVEGM